MGFFQHISQFTALGLHRVPINITKYITSNGYTCMNGSPESQFLANKVLRVTKKSLGLWVLATLISSLEKKHFFRIIVVRWVCGILGVHNMYAELARIMGVKGEENGVFIGYIGMQSQFSMDQQ